MYSPKKDDFPLRDDVLTESQVRELGRRVSELRRVRDLVRAVFVDEVDIMVGLKDSPPALGDKDGSFVVSKRSIEFNRRRLKKYPMLMNDWTDGDFWKGYSTGRYYPSDVGLAAYRNAQGLTSLGYYRAARLAGWYQEGVSFLRFWMSNLVEFVDLRSNEYQASMLTPEFKRQEPLEYMEIHEGLENYLWSKGIPLLADRRVIAATIGWGPANRSMRWATGRSGLAFQ